MAILAHINDKITGSLSDLKKIFLKEEDTTIATYLDARLVRFLDASTRDEALQQLVDLADRSGKLQDRDAFYKAVLEREGIVSTGIGLGCAIPHAKVHGYSDFFIAVGIQTKEGIEWNALDSAPVKLIFLIGGPDNQQTQYLKILSDLTRALKHEDLRKQLVKTTRLEDVVARLKEFLWI